MSTYSVEDALIQCYGVKWVGEAGHAKLVGRGGAVILTTPDDCLGTVLATLSQRCQTRYPPCSGLDCYTASGFGWSLDLQYSYENFDRVSFEQYVLPYVDQHHNAEYHKYTAALAGVNGLPCPAQCAVAERPKWGKFFTVLAHLFKIFRGMNAPPVLLKVDPDAPRCELIHLSHMPNHHGIPAQGNKCFEEWEAQMIRAHHLGGENAEILTDDDGQEYLSVPTLFDPFSTIGSRWMRLPQLPDLEPVESDEEEEPDKEEAEEQEVEAEQGEAQVPHPPNPPPKAVAPFYKVD